MKATKKQRYIPALDGIRAIAVIAVVLYHVNVPWMRGGLLGVTMFFVISGFIITRLLLNEIARTRRIDFKGFYLRRARRLLPAIFVVVLVTIVLCALFNQVMLTKMRPDILPSILFFNNWWQIINDVSYFNALGDPSPLTHFWSLAIEEQFYLIWPPLLMGLYQMGVGHRGMRRAVLVTAVASAVAMALLYNPATDPSRLYYGTDTRSFSLLLGAWLAFFPPRLIDGARGAAGRAMDIGGVIGLAGLVALFIFSNGYTSFPYRGGMALCTVLTALVIVGAVRRGGVLERGLSAAPLRWVGTRSYSIYLWHYPILLLLNPSSDVSAKPWWAMPLQLALVLAVAELSYRFIETPFRHGAFEKFIAVVRGGGPEGEVPQVEKRKAQRPAPSALPPERPQALAALRGGFDRARMSAAKKTAPLSAWIAKRMPGGEAGALRRLGPGRVVAAGSFVVLLIAAGVALAVVPETSALSREGAAALQEGAAPDTGQGGQAYAADAYDVLMIGDSVSVRTVPYFEQAFPNGKIDAQVSRQFGAGTELLKEYVDQGRVGGVVVIALGTNGLVTGEQIDQLMSVVGDKRTVALVTTRSPRGWVDDTNAALRDAAARYQNVRLVDWHAYSEGKNDVFDGDGTHLNESGAEQYIGLIKDAIWDVLPLRMGEGWTDPVPASAQQLLDGTSAAVGDRLVQEADASLSRSKDGS